MNRKVPKNAFESQKSSKSHVPSTGVVSRKCLALNALSLETVCILLRQELNVPLAGVYVPGRLWGRGGSRGSDSGPKLGWEWEGDQPPAILY